MSSVVISGDTSGSITLSAPAVAGTNTITLPALTGTVVIAGQNSAITAGTAVASTSGTSIDFTSIPSWVKRITVMLSAVSTTGTSLHQVQIGDSGGVEITGYNSSASYESTQSTSTTGFLISPRADSAASHRGSLVITLLDATTNSWTFTGLTQYNSSYVASAAGTKSLSATLDRVRITTVNGTDTFDAGTINILYE
jgi:hypothetical protein